MRFNVVLRYVGMVMLFIALFMLVSAGISYVSNRDSAFYPLLLSALLTAMLGGFPLIFVERQNQFSTKEGFCIVVGSWLVGCVVTMFPYLIWGGEFNLVNAWFESVSGLTTTGASILRDIEALPRGLLFWRISSAWIGGVGVVMFALLILPAIGRSKMTLANVELSAVAKDNFRYRSQIVARILLLVYVGLTVVITLLLKIFGMNWFDALTHGMSISATCGFSTKNASIAYFGSFPIELIFMIGMAIAGIHFGLIYATITGKSNNLFRSEVTRFYLAMIAVCGCTIGLSLYAADIYPTLGTAMRYAFFQFIALVTTSGFATADSNTWTSLAIIILTFASVVCACAGSTSGGLKINRLMIAYKAIRQRINQQQHPNAIFRIRLDGAMQETSAVHSVLVFTMAYMMLILIGTVVNAIFNLDLTTSFTSAIACVSNVGPAFGEVGSMSNYAGLPPFIRFFDTILMLFGRLEIFGLIQLFFIKWWR